jgi:hypothetical protein
MISLDADQPIFSVSQVADAIGAPAETLRTWIKRDGIKSLHAKDEIFLPGVRRSHLISPRKALQVAATYRLVRLGMSPSAASLAAAYWTEAGTPDRLPADLFKKSGSTFLVAYDPDQSPPAEVVHHADLIVACSRAPAAIVNLNVLTRDLFKRLGVTP